MQFLVSFKPRLTGTAAENEETFKRGMQLFGGWTPPAGQDFKAFLARADGDGGYALIETDDLNGIFESSSKFLTAFDFEVIPVLDITQSVVINQQSIDWRDSLS